MGLSRCVGGALGTCTVALSERRACDTRLMICCVVCSNPGFVPKLLAPMLSSDSGIAVPASEYVALHTALALGHWHMGFVPFT